MCAGDANGRADCTSEKRLQIQASSEAAEGIRTLDLLMASVTCVSLSAPIFPANRTVLVWRWRAPIPRLLPGVHGSSGTKRHPAACRGVALVGRARGNEQEAGRNGRRVGASDRGRTR